MSLHTISVSELIDGLASIPTRHPGLNCSDPFPQAKDVVSHTILVKTRMAKRWFHQDHYHVLTLENGCMFMEMECANSGYYSTVHIGPGTFDGGFRNTPLGHWLEHGDEYNRRRYKVEHDYWTEQAGAWDPGATEIDVLPTVLYLNTFRLCPFCGSYRHTNMDKQKATHEDPERKLHCNPSCGYFLPEKHKQEVGQVIRAYKNERTFAKYRMCDGCRGKKMFGESGRLSRCRSYAGVWDVWNRHRASKSEQRRYRQYAQVKNACHKRRGDSLFDQRKLGISKKTIIKTAQRHVRRTKKRLTDSEYTFFRVLMGAAKLSELGIRK